MKVVRNGYETVIGLEVHVQLRTRTKIFCGCSVAYGAPPNTQVCPVCLGHPGVLPVLNREAVLFALRFGWAVGAEIQPRSLFSRKNYFYPDLPKGYQISQYDHPILTGGTIRFPHQGEGCSVRLVRSHLEEDAGKSFHSESGGARATFLDLNRAGVPLLEIVSEPDIRTPEEARACLERLRQTVVYLGICDGNMEEASLRCDANVSVRPRGQKELNPKTEIKNLNSFRHVERSLLWEIKRQTGVLEQGEPLEQATRLWDEATGQTRVMRSKEQAHDYRYFPEPDLPPLVIDKKWIDDVRQTLPELPEETERRLTAEHGLSGEDAVILAGDRKMALYYEEVAGEAGDGKAAANWVMTEVMRLVKGSSQGVAGVRVNPTSLGRMIRMIAEGRISGKIGKAVFAEMADTGGDPEAIVETRGLVQIEDPTELERIIDGVLTRNPGPVEEYVGGKDAALQFLMGQVMRATAGRAHPTTTREVVRKVLDKKRTEKP